MLLTTYPLISSQTHNGDGTLQSVMVLSRENMEHSHGTMVVHVVGQTHVVQQKNLFLDIKHRCCKKKFANVI